MLTNFVDKVTTVTAGWLNGIDVLWQTVFNGANTKALARAALTQDAPMSIGQGGTGAITQALARAGIGLLCVNPMDTPYGAKFDGNTNDTTAIAAAIAAVPAGGVLYMPYGTTVANISIRRSDITVFFNGTTVQQPAGAPGICLELGNTAAGNGATAYTNINILGTVWLDGNKANVTAPTDDLTGWGFIATKISKSLWENIRAKNCWNGGVGVVIDSNYNYGTFYVENCGNVTYIAAGFECDSSKYNVFRFVSNSCYDGGRLLDNCFGNQITGAVQNATRHGYIYDNQSVNASYANEIDIAVVTAGGHGFIVGLNCYNSSIKAAIAGAGDIGFTDKQDVTYYSYGNILDVSTSGSQNQGVRLYGNNNILKHCSKLDGRAGAQGTNFACDILGNSNQITFNGTDSATWQVRGVAIRAGATGNQILSIASTNLVDLFNDVGTLTIVNYGQGRGADIASANPMSIPFAGDLFKITGNAVIAPIGAWPNRTITLWFASNPTVDVQPTNGSNLYLAGGVNFVASANALLTLWSDGTNWYEKSRSVN